MCAAKTTSAAARPFAHAADVGHVVGPDIAQPGGPHLGCDVGRARLFLRGRRGNLDELIHSSTMAAVRGAIESMARATSGRPSSAGEKSEPCASRRTAATKVMDENRRMTTSARADLMREA
jgi:hypothetical protein